MRLRVVQKLGPSEWGMECSVEIPQNLPARLLSISKGTWEAKVNEKGELFLELHN